MDKPLTITRLPYVSSRSRSCRWACRRQLSGATVPRLASLRSSTRRLLPLRQLPVYQPASNGSMSWWPRMAPTYLTCLRLTQRYTGPIHPAAPLNATGDQSSPPPQVLIQAQCPWSPTCMVRWAWVTRATAMPRHGICPPPITFRAIMPLWAPGTIASRPRPTRSSAWHGGRDSPPSSIPTRTAPQPSGTTIMRSA